MLAAWRVRAPSRCRGFCNVRRPVPRETCPSLDSAWTDSSLLDWVLQGTQVTGYSIGILIQTPWVRSPGGAGFGSVFLSLRGVRVSFSTHSESTLVQTCLCLAIPTRSCVRHAPHVCTHYKVVLIQKWVCSQSNGSKTEMGAALLAHIMHIMY